MWPRSFRQDDLGGGIWTGTSASSPVRSRRLKIALASFATLAMMVERMLALLFISIACFFALFFTMLTLLRQAALRGGAGQTALMGGRRRSIRADAQSAERIGTSQDSGESPSHSGRPTIRSKRPDWRFLVRDGRRPFPSGQVIAPSRRPPTPDRQENTRADWVHYNKDMGDLQDPYQAPRSTARRA